VELRTPSARGLGGPYADRSKIGSDGSLARPLPSLRIARDSAGHVRASGRSLSRLLACWTLLAALGPARLMDLQTRARVHQRGTLRVLRAASPRSTQFASAGSVRYPCGAMRTKPRIVRFHICIGVT